MSEAYEQLDGDVATGFVITLFRLFRLAGMHDLDNAASQKALSRGIEKIGTALRDQLRFLTVLFAGETIYVNGQPLRAERAAYENALQAGELLEEIGYNELTIRRGISTGDMTVLLRAIAAGEAPGELPGTIRLRHVDPKSIIGEEEAELSVREQVISTYASGVVLSRRFAEGVAHDDFTLLRHIKRVGQRMVTLSESGMLEWLAIAKRQIPREDRARRAMHAAIVGLLAGRALTRDLHALLRITMACLQGHIGQPRVVGMYRDDAFSSAVAPRPNEAMRRRVPASTAAVLLQTGRTSAPALKRSVVAYETEHLRESELTGWPYDGQLSPTVEALIAATAARIAGELTGSGTPDELVGALRRSSMGKVEQATLELCLSVLGILPRGTAVELESGEFGVVTSAGDAFHDTERPRVVLLMHSDGTTRNPTEVRAGTERSRVLRVIRQPTKELSDAYDAFRQSSGASGRDTEDSNRPISVIVEPSESDSIDQRNTLVFDSYVAEDGLTDRASAQTIQGRNDDG